MFIQIFEVVLIFY